MGFKDLVDVEPALVVHVVLGEFGDLRELVGVHVTSELFEGQRPIFRHS